MDTRKVTTGALLLFVSSIILLEAEIIDARTPILVAAFASLGMAGASLAVDQVRAVRERRVA